MSSASGSLLLGAGLITGAALAEAERRRAGNGGTLVEWLIALGSVDEEQIVDFYHRSFLVPRVDPRRLAEASPQVLALVPAAMAAAFNVFPVELDREGTLLLAMSDPADAGAADEVMFFTSRFCQRAVAPASLVREAIARHYGMGRPAALPPPPASSSLEGEIALADAEEVIEVESVAPPRRDATLPMVTRARPPAIPAAALERKPDPPPPPARTRGAPSGAATDPRAEEGDDELPLPGLTVKGRRFAPAAVQHAPEGAAQLGRPDARAGSRRITLTGMSVAFPDPPLAELRTASTREQVAELIVTYLAQMMPRALLFVMRKGAVAGFDGRGAGLDPAALRRVSISVESPSLFRDVIQSRLPFRGPMSDTPAHRALVGAIGELRGDVLLFPIAVRGKVIAILYGDGITSPLPDATLHALARAAGLAYERLILETKR